LSQKYQRGDALSKGELISLEETVTIYRQRLYDISWLMRSLNEYIAREAQQKLMLKLKTTYYQVNSEYCAKVVSTLLSAKYWRLSNEIFLFLLPE
jgi:hypothetical protein